MFTLEVQSLDIISVNLWQILISLANLLLIFLILKKFLFGPVKKLIKQRQDNIDSQYNEAEKALKEANEAKAQYESSIASAKEKADSIIKSATDTANARSEEILSDAKEKADGMVSRAKTEIELERKKSVSQVLKISEAATVAIHVLDDTIEGFHWAIRKSAFVSPIGTHSFNDNKRVDDRLEMVVESI